MISINSHSSSASGISFFPAPRMDHPSPVWTDIFSKNSHINTSWNLNLMASRLLERNPNFGRTAVAVDSTRTQLAAARRSGSLRLGNKALTEIPTIMRGFAEETYGNEKWWELVELLHADFSHNAITSLPAFVMEWTSLQSLLLSGNRLTELCDESIRWTALKSLAVGSNQLRCLPRHINEWASLVELQANGNQLTELPAGICQLKNLEVLNLTDNALRELPEDFGRLSLVRLQLGTNQLKRLPASFGRMQRLTLLELFENQLVDVPTNALGPLTALTFLDLRGNALTQLPILPANGVLDTLILSDNELTHLEGGGIAKCVQLTVLNLRQNRLSRLNAVDLAALPLKTLDLSNNELSDLPGELGRIASLTRIALEGNPLRRIRRGLLDQGTEALKRFLRSRLSEEQAELDPSDPTATFTGSAPNSSFLLPNEVAIRESIQQASYAHQQSKGLLPLKKRELNRLPNQALPPNVFQTPWIAMELDENQLDVVSPDRFDMFASSLQRFSASTNKLTALPHSLFQCAQLQTLSLARNQLSADSLPVRELGGLHHLASVDLSFNPLGCIPEALFWLPSLAELLLQQTNLSGALPDLGRMLGRSTLVSLQLASNHIDGFQEPDLRALPNLTYLNIENNDFVKLPPELGVSSHLKAFLVNGNPIRVPPFSIISKGTPAVLMHLRDRLSPDRLADLEEFGPMLVPLPDPLPAPDMSVPLQRSYIDTAPPASEVHNISRSGPSASRASQRTAPSQLQSSVSMRSTSPVHDSHHNRAIPMSAAHFTQHNQRAMTVDEEAAAQYAREVAEANAQRQRVPAVTVVATRQFRQQSTRDYEDVDEEFRQAYAQAPPSAVQQAVSAAAGPAPIRARPGSASRYGRGIPPPSAPVSAPVEPIRPVAPVVSELDARIVDIERQLDSLSLPASKAFALKRDLALAKAARNRENGR